MGFSLKKLGKKVSGAVPGLVQNNIDFYKGLGTGNFGQARDAASGAFATAGNIVGLVDDPKAPNAPSVPGGAPDRSAANLSELDIQRRDFARKRGMRTSFAGSSMGGMDSSPFASNLLLGV